MRNPKFVRVLSGATAVAAVVAQCVCAQTAQAQVVPPAHTGQILPNPLTLSDAVAIGLRQQPQDYSAQTQVSSANGQKT